MLGTARAQYHLRQSCVFLNMHLLNRPEVEQNQISLENARLDIKGVKNNLRPTLSATASFSNAGQGGSITNVPQPVVGTNGNITYEKLTPSEVNQFLIGGYGTVLSQIFGRDFQATVCISRLQLFKSKAPAFNCFLPDVNPTKAETASPVEEYPALTWDTGFMF